MKLSEYIPRLQELLIEQGDLECYAASDDEGNAFHRIGHTPSVFYTEELLYRLDNVFASKEEMEEFFGEETKSHKVVVVN